MTDDRPMYKVEPDILRYRLNKIMPYFAEVTYRLRPKKLKAEDMPFGQATFAVDKFFNWYYAEEVPWDPDMQVAALYHEISHLIRNHAGRAGDRDHLVWNAAGDREINDWFPAGLKPLSGKQYIGSTKYGLNDLQLPDDKLAEWYYDQLDRYDFHVREDASVSDAGSGKCATLPKCDSQDKNFTQNSDGSTKDKGVIHVPVCGGAAGNGDENEDGSGEGQDGGVSEIEAEAVRQSIAEKISNDHAMGRGDLPGSLVEWADKFLNPVVPWTKILRTSARKASTVIQGDTTQTFQKPPRRSPPGIILPKKIARKVVAAFYIDTSGSISDEEIHQGIAEVKAALRTSLADLTVSFVDTQVYSTIRAGNGSFKGPKKVQRGGTDMRECFTHANDLRPRPNLIIVMTDGFTPWPEEALRDTRTIVVMTTDWKGHEGQYPAPEWVWKVILMEDHK